ncbi:MAG: T9SS type A sorting domain-containing protein [Bacteroidota bacterium]|nr:T9SS type A sorting domain-containing protein [Bacteroidota bacterium]
MKAKIFLLTLLFLFSLKGNSQYIIAGEPSATFFDINPDTLLNPWLFGGDEYYIVDIDQDLVNDFNFHALTSVGLGQGVNYVSVTALYPSIQLALGRSDSVWGSGNWITADILKIYSLGDTISASGFIPINTAYLGYTNSSANWPGWYLNASDWINIGDKYIGFSITDLSGEIAYGWIKVNCTSSYVATVKEFSIGPFAPVGIEKKDIDKAFVIYPNPASEKIHVEQTNKITKLQEISLIAPCSTEPIKTFTDKNEIDVSQLTEGIYFLRIKTNSGVLTKKIVVQH